MTEFTQIPLPLCRTWPVGLRLRFKPDAPLKPMYRYLRGTPVLVLSELRLMQDTLEWRQRCFAFGARFDIECIGWALPEQLEPIPGDADTPALQLGEGVPVTATREHRQACHPCPQV